ncbi:MAG: hypothetical protein JXQ90_03900 [Cyclobacteriaceae bacterium]
MKTLKTAILAIVLFVGIGFLVMGISDYSEKTKEGDTGAYIFAIIVLGVMPTTLGALGLWRSFQYKGQPRSMEIPEVRIMRLASAQHGKITVPEVAILLGVKHKAAEEILERMRLDGAFDLELVATSGAQVYNLSNHASNDDKADTVGVLD